MAEKTLNTRIIHKHDTEINWSKATNFKPKQGEIIIYDKDNNYNYERIKVGDGVTLVNDLPFYGSSIENILDGIASGSVRTSSSTTESTDYKLGTAAFAEGSATKANGNYSHAEGYSTTASGAYSHAEGRSSTASGSVSHAEGTDTVADGIRSHASGWGTIAKGQNQTAIGKYNVEDTNEKYALIVGNGTSTARSNAFTIDWNGNAEAGGKKLATEAYVTDKIADIPTPDVSGQIETHNKSGSAHSDIRQSISGKANTSDLTTHTSNSTIHVTSAEKTKWNAKSDFSGSYNDLSNKPTIPTVGNGTITIKQAGSSKGTFTLNQSGNTTIELTDNDTTYSAATTSANGLMSSTDKSKLDGIATGANKTIVDSALSSTSTNPVQNKVVNTAISNLNTLVGNTAVATQISTAIASKADLDTNGKVPSSQLPSYVDDVIEYNGKSKFPSTGESGKIYVDTATNLTYRWSGSAYVEISPSLALGETSSTAYRGDRGKTAYDHSQSTHARTDATKTAKSSTNGNILINGTETTVYTHPSGTNPHGTTKSDVGLGNVGNFKAVSTVASQGLTDTEKSNARANIGAGTSSFSGSYNDLTNKPTIPTVGNGTITIKQAGTSKGTFTMNQSGNTTIELTDNNTDTKVTAVDNHYTPSGGTTTSASGGTLTDITNSSSGVQVVTGVTKDAAGHVTGVTSLALKSVNTVYTHPSTHPATMITEDSTHRFVTDTEKVTWNNKASKSTITTTTLLASNWDSTAKTYSFESTYPSASYDIEIALDSTATSEQAEAFNGAQIVGSATSNIIKAYGDVPTVDIPIILRAVRK